MKGRTVTSTRARVIGWILGLVALALAVNLVAVSQFLHGRADEAVAKELQHEAFKFRTFALESVDPETGRPYAGPAHLLEAYLAEAIPDDDEALFSMVDGGPRQRTRNEVPHRLDRMQQVIDTAAAADEPLSASVETPEGTAYYSVIPVRTDDGEEARAALVVVEFTGESADRVNETVRYIALISAIALILAGLVSWLVAGRVLAPIRQVRHTADSITESDLSRRIPIPPDAGGDDVAQLATTFNRMLDRLEGSFASQREFLDDAAHELRTPLTVIHGHLEVVGDDPEQRAETTALLLDEVQRMSRIVDDLLVLAKAERPDFLTFGPVDLTDLVVTVVAKAAPLADRSWSVSETAERIVRADGQRLTQALMQLVSNAARQTSPGDRIAVGSRVDDDRGRVTLSVADGGPGVPAEDRGEIFERYHRADRQRYEGSGLGLPIVASIARAHRGLVTVEETPGGGATFVIDFPLQPDDDPAPHDDPTTRDRETPHDAPRQVRDAAYVEDEEVSP